MSDLPSLEMLFVAFTLGLAACFRPAAMLRTAALQHPWLACVLGLSWLWSLAAAHPVGAVVQVSGACLLVLMFGWPLAVWTLLPIALIGTWLAGEPIGAALTSLAWFGLAPAFIALLLGGATRRWLPSHLVVYIFGRAFFATALAVVASGVLHVLVSGAPHGLETSDMIIGHSLVALGEAMATGLLVATMVMFRPAWLATYSDQRYLPR